MLFVAAKFHQKDNNEGRSYAVTKKLEPFSVIVTDQGARLQLGSAEYPSILSSSQHKFPRYTIKNDTLFVFVDDKSDKQNISYVINCKDLKSVVAKESSHLRLQDLKVKSNDTLVVKTDKAKIDFFYQEPGNYEMVLFLQAQESEINMHQAHLRTLDVKIVGSKLNIWNSSFESVSVSLKNYSVMQSPANMEKVSLEVDSTSHFNFYSAI